MIVYVDTSVVLRVLLGQPDPLQGWGRWRRAYASELLGVEARRGIDRLRLEGAFDDHRVAATHDALREIETAVASIEIAPPILRRASAALPTVVRTLDAIHLASALLLREELSTPITFATHDTRQRTAARALGFACIG